jgi:hypothetical protein
MYVTNAYVSVNGIATTNVVGYIYGEEWGDVAPEDNTWTLSSVGSNNWTTVSPESNEWTPVPSQDNTWTTQTQGSNTWLPNG